MAEGLRAAAKKGPLAGLKIIEMAGLGPLPLAALMLSEMGATVLRVERAGASRSFLALPPEHDFERHGRDVVKIDLKQPEGVALMLDLIADADVLAEGFRPGVMERFGLGPDAALARNPRLVYGRMTGFGQQGPLASTAGHDLTYLAYSGVLHAIGAKDGKPVPPLNLVADYGGGTMFLIAGILAALFEQARSGKGQVVDAAMVDGAAMLAVPTYGYMASGFWRDVRGSNLLDSGAPFYDTYETADGKHVAVACLEPQFFAEFARLLPLDERYVKSQFDPNCWDDMRKAIASRIKQQPRDAWASLFEGTDACVAPVLSLKEAPGHQHSNARNGHTPMGKAIRPSPAPRFSRTQGVAAEGHAPDAVAALEGFGVSHDTADALVKSGIVG